MTKLSWFSLILLLASLLIGFGRPSISASPTDNTNWDHPLEFFSDEKVASDSSITVPHIN